MKTGNRNSNKGSQGGRKNKGRRGANANINGAANGNHTSNRQARNADNSSSNYSHDNHSSGRQWTNGEDTRHNKSYKRNNNEKGRRGFYNNEDDPTFNMKSMSSLETASQGNSARKMTETEESKDRCRTESSTFKPFGVNERCTGKGSNFLLGDDPDVEKYMYGNPWSTEIKRPFESKHIAQFGLDLNDNRYDLVRQIENDGKFRKLSESFKSPFYKYYNDSKVDDLKTMDFSKIFAEHDETLLYIFYNMSDEEIKAKSSKELAKKGWKLDSDTQAWTTTREVSSKGNKSNGVTRQSSKSKSKNRRKEENEKDIQRWKFDIQKWNLLPQKSSGNGCEDEPEKRLERIDSLPTD